MTREQLKQAAEPIICDQTLTRKDRSAKLLPLLMEWNHSGLSNGEALSDISNEWNVVMAEIVGSSCAHFSIDIGRGEQISFNGLTEDEADQMERTGDC